MKKHRNLFPIRVTALLLALLCMVGLFPTSASALGDTIKLDSFGASEVSYESPSLGVCTLHQMYFSSGKDNTIGFCGVKGGGMGKSLIGQTWGNKTALSDPTVEIMMAYYYCHTTNTFTDEAKALGLDDVWESNYAWHMNAWVQAVLWRYKAGTLQDPVVACAEELMAVYNSLERGLFSTLIL